MTLTKTAFAVLCCSATLCGRAQTDTNEPPREWIDTDTGHRVLRLSAEPGSESFYFNVNPFTPDGTKMAFTAPSGIYALDLATHQVTQVVAGKRLRVLEVGRKTGQVYYNQGTNVFAADLTTKAVKRVATLPRGSHAVAVNCDETVIAGTTTLDSEAIQREESREQAASNLDSERKSKAKNIEERFDQHTEMELFCRNLATGETKSFDRCHDWLNHLQFSPTDPTLLLFAHEGPWHKVDRVWLIHSDGTGLMLVHQRRMIMEIAGHEFWSHDGSTVWYDLQTPRGEDFWLGGYNVLNGTRTQYHLQRNEWSVHYNISPDGTVFSGDGGGPGMVAHADNGKWIYLFHPEMNTDVMGTNLDKSALVHTGVFRSERLINMAEHDYSLEPNATFTPDMKWLVFRSNMSGTNYVYAVEVNKAVTK